jgi:hypothetical protein
MVGSPTIKAEIEGGKAQRLRKEVTKIEAPICFAAMPFAAQYYDDVFFVAMRYAAEQNGAVCGASTAANFRATSSMRILLVAGRWRSLSIFRK